MNRCSLGTAERRIEREVVVAALRRERAILLCHRHPARKRYPNVWDLPGGHVRIGEGRLDALVREIQEELGVTIERPSTAPGLIIGKGQFRMYVWVVDGWSADLRNTSPDEHDRIGWFGQRDIARIPLAHPEYVPVLARALAG